NGRLGLDCTTLSPTAQAFTPRHLAQAFESLAVSTVAVACSLRSSRVHPTLSPTSTPFPFAHRQKIRACSQGGQPQQPTSWAHTFKSPPIGHFSRFLHRAEKSMPNCSSLEVVSWKHWGAAKKVEKADPLRAKARWGPQKQTTYRPDGSRALTQ